jgi:hypothetical protein
VPNESYTHKRQSQREEVAMATDDNVCEYCLIVLKKKLLGYTVMFISVFGLVKFAVIFFRPSGQ